MDEKIIQATDKEYKNKEKRMPFNWLEQIYPDYFNNNVPTYLNLLDMAGESALDAQLARALALRARVYPDIWVRYLDSDESPSQGASKFEIFRVKK